MAARLNWKGEEVAQKVLENVSKAMGEFGLRAEGHAKRELRKGHGVLTGTLRRSIHVAEQGYNWASDNVAPNDGSPERGGQVVSAVVNGKRVVIEIGSGLVYALPVHQGHHNVEGYHYLSNGVDKAKAELPSVLKKYRMLK